MFNTEDIKETYKRHILNNTSVKAELYFVAESKNKTVFLRLTVHKDDHDV